MKIRYLEKSINNRKYYFLIQYNELTIIEEYGTYGTSKPKTNKKQFNNIKERDTYIKKILNDKKSQDYKELRGENKVKKFNNRNKITIKTKKKLKKKYKKSLNKKDKELSIFTDISVISPKDKTPKNLNEILLKKQQKKTEWQGNFSDLLFGLLYLLKRHKSDCMPFTSFRKNVDPYTDLAIIYECFISDKNKPIYRIIYPSNMIELEFFYNINECININKRFVIVPISISPPSNCDPSSSHANILIFDTKQKTVERFETYGSISLPNDSYYNNFDNEFEKVVKKYIKYTYLRPIEI